MNTMATNLPLQLTSFVGREREIAEVKQLLGANPVRLLTLTGSGGCGKTRFALQIATDLLDGYRDGVWLIELASLTDSALVPQTVASVFAVRETPECPILHALTNYLRAKHLLLVLDNCEHLLVACASLVETLLRACSQLQVLATSRERLGILGETTWRVPSLAVPNSMMQPGFESISALTQYESARLFVDRALAALPSFRLTERNAAAVAQICQRLDGLPLAIELAAVHVNSLSVEQIAARLDDCFDLLATGNRTALPRQQTLQATIDWSYALLTKAERVLFRRLAVLVGEWTLDAAEAIMQDHRETWTNQFVFDALTRLVTKSLITVEEREGQTFYRMLEPIRQFARTKLIAAGEEQIAQQYHFDFFRRLVLTTAPALRNPERGVALVRLERAYANIREALRWAVQTGAVQAGLEIAAALGEFWYIHGHFGEGHHWLERFLPLANEHPIDPIVHSQVLNSLVLLYYHQGDFGQMQHFAEQALALARAAGDQPGIARSLSNIGLAAQEQGHYAEAQICHQKVLQILQALNDCSGIGMALNNLGYLMAQQGYCTEAITYLEQSVAIHRECGDEYRMAHPLCNLGDVVRHQGDYARAESLYQQCLAVCRKLDHKWGTARILGRLGDNAFAQGHMELAGELQRASLQIRRELADREGIACCLEGLARVALRQHQPERAARLGGAAEQLRETIHAPVPLVDRAEAAQFLTTLQAQLEPAVFATAWTIGRSMLLDDGVAFALAAPPEFVTALASNLSLKTEIDLRIWAFGVPRVCHGERELAASDWKYAKTREMFFYLLCHPARTKEQIGVVLWRDASDAQLRSNFRVALYHLRHALGRSHWILFENEQYAFNRALPYWLDVEAFEQAIAEARKIKSNDSLAAIRQLHTATELYRGEFLEGIHGEWFYQRQRELQREYLDALLMLGQLHLALAQNAQAANVYRQAIAVDNFLEVAHRELMRCYARLGERGQALRHYHEFAKLLREEMDTAPTPETQALAAQLQQGKPV